jgi:hypothetical protein
LKIRKISRDKVSVHIEKPPNHLKRCNNYKCTGIYWKVHAADTDTIELKSLLSVIDRAVRCKINKGTESLNNCQ